MSRSNKYTNSNTILVSSSNIDIRDANWGWSRAAENFHPYGHIQIPTPNLTVKKWENLHTFYIIHCFQLDQLTLQNTYKQT